MKTTKSLSLAIIGLLLTAASGFSAIPDSVWKNDTLFHDLWNKTNLDTNTFWPHNTNWGVANAGTDSAMITTDGLAHPGDPGWTNLVWKYQASPAQANVELRFTWRMTSTPSGNSGFNMRGFCGSGTIANLCGGPSQGYRVFGPQMDLGPTYTGNVYNSGNTTLATAPAACHLNITNFMDLSYRIMNDTITMSYFPNGFAAGTKTLCTTYKLTNASHVAATSPGLIALQYETVEVSQFKNIKIRNLDATGGPSAISGKGQSFAASKITGGSRAIELSIPSAGRYSVQISDLTGAVVRNLQGMGPVNAQKVTLEKAGIYFVRVSASHEISTKKVFAY